MDKAKELIQLRREGKKSLEWEKSYLVMEWVKSYEESGRRGKERLRY